MKMIFYVPLSELTAGSNNMGGGKGSTTMLPANAYHRLECCMSLDEDRLNYFPLDFYHLDFHKWYC